MDSITGVVQVFFVLFRNTLSVKHHLVAALILYNVKMSRKPSNNRSSRSEVRSSHWRCSLRKCVLRNFAEFTGKHLCQISFLIKLQTSACNFTKKETLAQVFPVNFAKSLRAPSLQDTSGRLLLGGVL